MGSGRSRKARDMLMFQCSYEHNNIEEPAILLGGAFVVEVVEKEQEEKEEQRKEKEEAQKKN